MMALITQENIAEWCERNYPGSKILEINIRGSEDFSLLLRCWHGNLPWDRFCKIFIDRFSLFTLTNWTVTAAYPHLMRNMHRKNYSCSLSGWNKKRGGVSKRNKNCRAKIVMKRKRITRCNIMTDHLLKDELCIEIKVNFQHSHSIRTTESYNLLRCTERTKERFLDYFSMGADIQESKSLNEIYIKLVHYDDKEREVQLESGMINPNQQKILHMHYDFKKDKQARPFVFNSMERLVKEKAEFESRGFHIKTLQNPKIIVVLTPFTKMVFEEYGDEIFVDSSGVAGKDYQYITSVFVPTQIGALPIGYIVHSGQKEHEYEQGFKALLATLNEFCGKELKPKVVKTYDGEQLDELTRFFPISAVDVCPYANVTLFWKFICDPTNQVHEEDRRSLVEAYTVMIETMDKKTFETKFRSITEDIVLGKNSAILQVMNKLWYTKDWSNINVDSTKLTAIHIRIYRSIVVKKFQKFNAYIVIKLLTEILEGMYKRYIHHIQNDSIEKNIYPLFAVFYDKPEKWNILTVRPGEYLVQSLRELGQICTVYEELKLCTCSDGKLGAYCMHICAVEYEFCSRNILLKDTLPKFRFQEIDVEIKEMQKNIHKLEDDEISFSRSGNTKINTYSTLHSKKTAHTDIKYELVSDSEMSQKDDAQFHQKNLLHDHNYFECRPGDVVFKAEHSKENKIKLHKIAKAPSDENTEVESRQSSSKEKSREVNEEEPEHIGKGWALILKSLTPMQKIFAKKAIDNILFEATKGTLQRNSVSINQNIANLDTLEIKSENDQ